MKDKKTLITIIVLLVIFLPLGLVGTIKHFSIPSKIDNEKNNPNKDFIYNNKVYFYNGDKLMGTYDCSDCFIADTIIDDENYHTNYYKGGSKALPGVINNFFSIFKKQDSYVLYNVAGKNIIDEYREIKNYNTEATSNFLINRKNNGWGIAFLEIGKISIPSEYDYIALPSHLINKKLDSSKFIVKQNSLWFILNDDGTIFKNAIRSEITDFNNNYYITYDNSYHIYDYSGIEKLENLTKTNVYGVGDYIFIVNDNGLFIYKNCDEAILKFVSLPDYNELYFSVEENGIDVIIDGNVTETLELS